MADSAIDQNDLSDQDNFENRLKDVLQACLEHQHFGTALDVLREIGKLHGHLD